MLNFDNATVPKPKNKDEILNSQQGIKDENEIPLESKQEGSSEPAMDLSEGS